MIDAPTLLAYLAACAAIVVTPGPGQAFALARTLGEGRRAGMLAVLGLNLGTLVHAVAAALGLATLLAASPAAFMVMKYAGAAYLVHLGVRAFRARPDPRSPIAQAPPAGSGAFVRALAVGLLNPKVALFFLAFLPPFVDPARGPAFAQMLVLGAIVAVLDTVYELALVVAFDAARGRTSGRLRALQARVTGAVLVALGVKLAL